MNQPQINPFLDPTCKTKSWINPYLLAMREAAQDGSLPIYYGDKLKQMPGHWRQHLSARFTSHRPLQKLVLEIGCHLGRTLVQMAEDQKDHGFIGLDITFKRV